jgi:hypothetical protein
MQSDRPRGDLLDTVLRAQPVWTPPPGFARGVVARVPVQPQPTPSRTRLLVLCRALATSTYCATIAYFAATLLASVVTIDRVTPVVEAYDLLLRVTTDALVAGSTTVAWTSATVSIGIGVFVRRRLAY